MITIYYPSFHLDLYKAFLHASKLHFTAGGEYIAVWSFQGMYGPGITYHTPGDMTVACSSGLHRGTHGEAAPAPHCCAQEWRHGDLRRMHSDIGVIQSEVASLSHSNSLCSRVNCAT